ncbi:MAG: Riboflavin transport system permease protein RibX [Chlamydiia bacterium]|nr:Riboflavin transport system permease protein RibX [Chlamydiia bacterium]
MKKKTLLLQILTLLIFLTFWQLLSLSFKDVSLIFPTPIGVIRKLISAFPLFLSHTIATGAEMLFSILIAILLAFPLSLLMGRFQIMKMLLQPFFITMQCIPMFTLAPIFIVWFGWSLFAVVIPTSLMILFPLATCFYKGFQATEKPYENYFKTHGIRSALYLLSVKLPFARPHIFSGLRIACGIAGVGAIGGEWAGAQKGLGVFMQISRRNFDLESVCASILCLLILSLSFYYISNLLETLFTRKPHEKFSPSAT